MKHVTNVLLCVVVFYIIPTTISVLFVIARNKDNPFKKDSEARKWVFAPGMNIICACATIYFVLVEIIPYKICKYIKESYRKFERWNKDL